MGGATTICDLRNRPISLSRSNWSWKKKWMWCWGASFLMGRILGRKIAPWQFLCKTGWVSFLRKRFSYHPIKGRNKCRNFLKERFKPHTSTQNPNKHTLFKHPTSSEGKSILIIFPNLDVGLYFCQIPCIFFYLRQPPEAPKVLSWHLLGQEKLMLEEIKK